MPQPRYRFIIILFFYTIIDRETLAIVERCVEGGILCSILSKNSYGVLVALVND
jgi:hypothetical protein